MAHSHNGKTVKPVSRVGSVLTYQVSPGDSVVEHRSLRRPYKPKSNRATGFLTDVKKFRPYLLNV